MAINTALEKSDVFQILSKVSDGIVVFDKKWDIVYINEAAASLFHKRKKSLIGKKIWKEFTDSVESDIQKNPIKLGRTGGYMDLKISDKNINKWARVKIFSQKENFIAISKEITEQKELENDLLLNREGMNLLLNKSNDIVYVINQNGNVDYVTPSVKKILGWDVKDRIGKNIFTNSLIHKDDIKDAKRIFADSIKHPNKTYLLPFRIKHKNGSWIYINGTGKSIINGNNDLSVIINCADVTMKTEAEKSLDKLGRKLGILLKSNIIGIFIGDREKITEANESFLDLLGYTKKDLIEGKLNISTINPPNIKEKTIPNIFLKTKKKKINPFEKEFIAKNGQSIPTIVSAVKLQDDPLQYATFVQDISRIKELERRKDDFISMASHELKTPITVIKNIIYVVGEYIKEKEYKQAKFYLKKTNKQIDRIISRINEMLDITRMEENTLPLNMSHVKIYQLVYDLAETMQATTSAHKIYLKGKTNKKMYIDKERISQVLINILSNAIKYSPNSEKITINIKELKESILISVQDFGIGINHKYQKRIFERFFRGNTLGDNNFPGLGIGLYISEKIIKGHNGKIWYKSQKDKGSTFFVKIPFK